MKPLSDGLIEALIALARAGLRVDKLAFPESQYLALALEMGLHDPRAARRFVTPEILLALR